MFPVRTILTWALFNIWVLIYLGIEKVGKKRKDETRILPLGFTLKCEFYLGPPFLNLKSTGVWTVTQMFGLWSLGCP